MDRSQAYAEFRRLHEQAKTNQLGEAERQRWKELKRMLALFDAPPDEASGAEAAEPSRQRAGNA